MRKLFREMFDGLDPFGRFWLLLGLGSLSAAAAMSFDFGWGVSAKHAIFLAILTAVAAFGPMAAEMLWSKGRKGVAVATAAVCLPLLAIEFYSHAGYTAGLRGSNIETAKVQNTKWTGAQDNVTEDKTNLAMWEKRLADLEAQNAWAVSITAEALRAQLASANLAIDLEAKRGGCKGKCLARTKERDDLATKIAIAEEKSELTKKIEATKRVLVSARDKAGAVEFKSSSVDHQNKFLTKVVALVANGTTTASDLQEASAEQSVNLAMAIAGTGLPAFALFMAGLFRRPDDEMPRADLRQAAAKLSPAGIPAEPIHIHTVERIKDATLRQWAGSCESDIRAMLGQMRAA